MRKKVVMGGKARRKPVDRTPEEYREIVSGLGTCVVWALKFMKPSDGGDGFVYTPSTKSTQVWTEKFFDALDKMGYEIDREAYYASMDKKKKRRR